jgi:hypothetical protein
MSPRRDVRHEALQHGSAIERGSMRVSVVALMNHPRSRPDKSARNKKERRDYKRVDRYGKGKSRPLELHLEGLPS